MQQQLSRPVLIDSLAAFAIAFANIATQATDNADDWVARNGKMSIFSALQSIFPEVSHPMMSFLPSETETAAETKVG